MSSCCCWDFTIPETATTKEDLVSTLGIIAKKWCFQLEMGESGYRHFQGRLSLKMKARLGSTKAALGIDEAHLSPTSKPNTTNDFYACKEESRISGPWKDNDPTPKVMPCDVRKFAEGEMYPWQQAIYDSADVYDERHVDLLYDPVGCSGKTKIGRYMNFTERGRFVPTFDKFRELIEYVNGFAPAKCYIIDTPRATRNAKEMWAGIETLKDGYTFEHRYHAECRMFDPPRIWVFCNALPKPEWLSKDRWRFWTISNEGELVRYTEERSPSGGSLALASLPVTLQRTPCKTPSSFIERHRNTGTDTKTTPYNPSPSPAKTDKPCSDGAEQDDIVSFEPSVLELDY